MRTAISTIANGMQRKVQTLDHRVGAFLLGIATQCSRSGRVETLTTFLTRGCVQAIVVDKAFGKGQPEGAAAATIMGQTSPLKIMAASLSVQLLCEIFFRWCSNDDWKDILFRTVSTRLLTFFVFQMSQLVLASIFKIKNVFQLSLLMLKVYSSYLCFSSMKDILGTMVYWIATYSGWCWHEKEYRKGIKKLALTDPKLQEKKAALERSIGRGFSNYVQVIDVLYVILLGGWNFLSTKKELQPTERKKMIEDLEQLRIKNGVSLYWCKEKNINDCNARAITDFSDEQFLSHLKLQVDYLNAILRLNPIRSKAYRPLEVEVLRLRELGWDFDKIVRYIADWATVKESVQRLERSIDRQLSLHLKTDEVFTLIERLLGNGADVIAAARNAMKTLEANQHVFLYDDRGFFTKFFGNLIRGFGDLISDLGLGVSVGTDGVFITAQGQKTYQVLNDRFDFKPQDLLTQVSEKSRGSIPQFADVDVLVKTSRASSGQTSAAAGHHRSIVVRDPVRLSSMSFYRESFSMRPFDDTTGWWRRADGTRHAPRTGVAGTGVHNPLKPGFDSRPSAKQELDAQFRDATSEPLIISLMKPVTWDALSSIEHPEYIQFGLSCTSDFSPATKQMNVNALFGGGLKYHFVSGEDFNVVVSSGVWAELNASLGKEGVGLAVGGVAELVGVHGSARGEICYLMLCSEVEVNGHAFVGAGASLQGGVGELKTKPGLSFKLAAKTGLGVGGGGDIVLSFYLREAPEMVPILERDGIKLYRDVEETYAVYVTPDQKVHVDYDHKMENMLREAAEAAPAVLRK